MYINNVEVRNFRCFDYLKFELKKINLITGENSSGKSSLLYTILGAIQSREFPFNYSPNGKYIRMGDYSDIVHGHDKTKEIELNFGIGKKSNETDNFLNSIWAINRRNLPYLKYLKYENSESSITIDKTDGRRKYEFTYLLKDAKAAISNDDKFMKNILTNVSKSFLQIPRENRNYTNEEVRSYINNFSKVKEKIHFRVSKLEDIEPKLKREGNFLAYSLYNSLESIFVKFDDQANFISSFRLYPERTYYEISKTDLKVGKFGENYIDQILHWEDTKSSKSFKLLSKLREFSSSHFR